MTRAPTFGVHIVLLGLAVGVGCEPSPRVDLAPAACDLGTLDVADIARCAFEISNAVPTPLRIEVEIDPPDGPFRLAAEPATFEFKGDEVLGIEVVFSASQSGAHRSDLLVFAGGELLAEVPLKACAGGPCEE